MSVAVSSEHCLLVEASSRLEAAEKPQCPTVYSLDGPRLRGHIFFVLETDASILGLGAILSQQPPNGTIHPVAYASRSLNQAERLHNNGT